MRGRPRERWCWALAAVVLAGAAVRFATLGVQSMWIDEAVTHDLVARSLGGMLNAIPGSESTPPLYYLLAWVWARAFGFGALGLRSLSALAGSATIVVLAAIAHRAGGARAAVAAAALAAASPLLIWYSQEARAYGLLVLLCALSVLALQRGDLRAWALAAALALATHYFAVFVVGPQALWVLWRRGRTRPAMVAVGAVALVGAALLPLAIHQAGGSRAAFIHSSALGTRILQVPKQFLTGYATPGATVLTVIAAVCAVALVPALRARDRGLAALAAAGVGVPVALALLGADYVITRNLIAAMVPLVVLAGLASARLRVGPLLVAGLCAAGIAAFIGVELTPADQRENWRGVAAVIGPPIPGVRVVVMDQASALPALRLYLPMHRLAAAASTSVSVREVDVVLVGRNPPAPPVVPVAGFIADMTHTSSFTLVRYFASAPTPESYAQLIALGQALDSEFRPIAALSP